MAGEINTRPALDLASTTSTIDYETAFRAGEISQEQYDRLKALDQSVGDGTEGTSGVDGKLSAKELDQLDGKADGKLSLDAIAKPGDAGGQEALGAAILAPSQAKGAHDLREGLATRVRLLVSTGSFLEAASLVGTMARGSGMNSPQAQFLLSEILRSLPSSPLPATGVIAGLNPTLAASFYQAYAADPSLRQDPKLTAAFNEGYLLPRQAAQPDAELQERLTGWLSLYPESVQPLVAQIDKACAGLSKAGASAGAKATLQLLDDAKRALQSKNYALAAEKLAALGGLSRCAAGIETNVVTRAAIEAAGRAVDAAAIDPRRALPPPRAIEDAEQLFAAYSQQSEILLNAVYSADWALFVDDFRKLWNDTFGGDRILVPDDAAAAVFQLNVALWTVTRDIREGKATPQDFGKQSFSEVGTAAMLAEATRRLQDPKYGDLAALGAAMQSDPLWSKHPIVVNGPKGEFTLAEDKYDKFLYRSPESVANPSAFAVGFSRIVEMAQIGTDAEGVAAADNGGPAYGARYESALAAAQINSVYMLFDGALGNLPANASQVLGTITSTVGVDPSVPLAKPTAASKAEAEARQAKGAIDGFAEYPAASGQYVVFKLKTASQICAEVKAKIDKHELDGLGSTALARLKAMVGYGDAQPGAALQKQLDDEKSAIYWKKFGSQVIMVALVGVASAGIGAAAGGIAAACSAPGWIVGTAEFVVNSASFTTLMGAINGNLKPEQYLIDMAMFGALAGVGKLSSTLYRGLVGSPLTAARIFGRSLESATTIGVSAAGMTGFDAVMQKLAGKSVNGQDLAKSLGENLLFLSVLHAVNLGTKRLMDLATTGGAKAKAQDFSGRVSKLNGEIESCLTALDAALAKGDATKTEALTRRLDELCKATDAYRQELLDIAASISPRARAEIIKDFGQVDPASCKRGELSQEQMKLWQTATERFTDLQKSLSAGKLLQRGVKGVSPEALRAYLDILASPSSSVGKANIQHVASVFQRVLETAKERKGRPLAQEEVNRLFLETIMTDAWLKGVAPEVAKDVALAPTNKGGTVGEVYDAMIREVADAKVPEWTKNADAQALVRAWVTEKRIPADVAGVEKDVAEFCRTKGITDERRIGDLKAEATRVFKEQGATFMGIKGFMVGTWFHGIIGYSAVESAVLSVPQAKRGGLTPQEGYEVVLGHHMAGFVAAGFSRHNIEVFFERMEALGQIPEGAAGRLGNLYEFAKNLGSKWRGRIDRGLSPAELGEYYADAAPLRAAIDKLPPEVRAQILADDVGQFTIFQAMEKWIGMQGGATTPREAVSGGPRNQGLASAINAYYVENYGRGLGADFVKASKPALERIGIVFDEGLQRFRPVEARDAAAFDHLYRQITGNPSIKALLEAELKTPQALADKQKVVDWFFSNAAAKPYLNDLTQRDY
jgi:hypothetical protein